MHTWRCISLHECSVKVQSRPWLAVCPQYCPLPMQSPLLVDPPLDPSHYDHITFPYPLHHTQYKYGAWSTTHSQSMFCEALCKVVTRRKVGADEERYLCRRLHSFRSLKPVYNRQGLELNVMSPVLVWVWEGVYIICETCHSPHAIHPLRLRVATPHSAVGT